MRGVPNGSWPIELKFAPKDSYPACRKCGTRCANADSLAVHQYFCGRADDPMKVKPRNRWTRWNRGNSKKITA
jgi:hypothetical protein